MSASGEEQVNPYAPPQTDTTPVVRKVDRETELRHEYLGAILLAAITGGMSALFFLAAGRSGRIGAGELVGLASGLIAYGLLLVSALFVLLTFKAAVLRIILLLRRIGNPKK